MELNLKGKTFMVAAASQGIGFGVAEALAKESARLSIASRSKEKIEKAVALLREKYGAEVSGYVLDASDGASIEAWCKITLQNFAGVDGLLVNAGGPPPGSFEKFSDEEWDRAYQLTLMSAVRMIRGVLPSMLHNGSGSILTVTSSSVKEPINNLLLSNVFRSGVTALVKSLANEFSGKGIRINNLVPGRIDTGRVQSVDRMNAEKKCISIEDEQKAQLSSIPLGSYGTIQDMGNAGAFLLSDAAKYITGATLVVDGGKSRMVF